MTRDLLLDIVNKMIAQGFATEKDTDIFKDYKPDSPDSCIVISEYNGSTAPTLSEMNVRSIQVLVRESNSNTAMSRSWDIFTAWKSAEMVSDILDTPSIIAMRNTPVKINIDSQERVEYAFNMGITTLLN